MPSEVAASTKRDLENCGLKQGKKRKFTHPADGFEDCSDDGEGLADSDAKESGALSGDDACSSAASPAPVVAAEPVRGMQDLPGEIVLHTLEMMLEHDPRGVSAFCSTCRLVYAFQHELRPKIIALILRYSEVPWKRWVDSGIGPVFAERHPINLWQTWDMVRGLSGALESFLRDDRLHKVHVKAIDRSGRKLSSCISAGQLVNRQCKDLAYPERPILERRSSIMEILVDICQPLSGSQALRGIRSLRFENFD
eukprot:TRINITY_DN588_c0_g5_i1.p1 TRINITY_DN588_c0_g5~~TRINITY_DN588_c0_g5_i1.p1  ORF type:complete len:253 (-),score=53.61 TRINITY_DN588_c0_g5_i1:171-929(-)